MRLSITGEMTEQETDMTTESFFEMVRKYGLSTVAAIVFGYIIIVDVRASNSDSKNQHEKIVVEQVNLARGMLKLADRQGETQMLSEKILLVLRQMCVQNADTPIDRRNCLKEK